ncbi:MAG: ParB/RepB/Spo0J family partition protein [Erysipelotrichaceae bacterium]|nr:ParB/RepB/Spo0J family partition protein [Erysipelotrichaceae bacterium]
MKRRENVAIKRSGSGLSSVFGEDVDAILNEISESSGEKNTFSLKIREIRPNPYQPRKNFDEEAMKELTDSIKEHGVFQPIIVRKSLSGYELIAGERRLRASKNAGLTEIPAIVVEMDDKDMMEISLLENIQREDLSVLEEAAAYQQLIEKLGYTQEELAKRVGKSRTHITNILRMRKLPAAIQKLVSEGKISFGHARALLGSEDEDLQTEIAGRIVREGLSVREVEKLLRRKPKLPPVRVEDPYLRDVKNTLERKYGTSVEITKKAITIRYADNEDLNRILELMDAIEK